MVYSRISLFVVLVAGGILGLGLWGCSGGGGGSGSGGTGGAVCSPDLASLEKTIFKPSCALSNCHAGAGPAGDLDLSGDAAAVLVNVASATCPKKTRVVPGDPTHSFLSEKLAGMASCGGPMPPSGLLDDSLRACVDGWISGLPAGSGGTGGSGGSSTGGSSTGGSSTGGTAGCEMCGGASCVDLQTDPANCGACDKACPPGAACNSGACACGGGLSACGGACTDTQLDAANCGACDKACATGATCAGGTCACPGSEKVCGSACVDTTSDAANCGSCGNACSGGKVCAKGTCGASCGALMLCGASCVDTMTSTGNCGGCGKACPSGASCVAGACQCPAGTSACNGACVNTATDPANCGACNKVCAGGETCSGGACQCPGGGTSCGGVCVDTMTSTSNCGACGNACAVGQTCSAGACACGMASVSFAAAVQPIFTASCANAGCHSGPNPAQGLKLAAGSSYGGLVNVSTSECNDGRKRVLPGQPSQSYLIDKLLGVDLCFGTKMPKSGSIPQADIATIANWICEGAPNN